MIAAKYERTTNRVKYTSEQVKTAVEAVLKNKHSLSTAATIYEIPRKCVAFLSKNSEND